MSQQCSYPDCGRNALDAHRGKCILHAEQKNRDEFARAILELIGLYEKMNVETWNFSGFVFPDADCFAGRHFKTFINMSEARFTGTAIFRDAVFEENVDFSKVSLEYGCMLNNVIFKKTFILEGQKEQRLERKRLRQLHIENSKFGGWAYFARIQFDQEVHFKDVEFDDVAEFSDVAFEGKATFADIAFKSACVFNGVSFGEETHFEGIRKQMVFGDTADFSDSHFQKKAFFKNVSFNNGFKFLRGIGEGGLNFEAATFKESINLFSAILVQNAHFTDCFYDGEVRLTWPGEARRKDLESNPIDQGTITFHNIREDSYINGGILDFSRNDLRERCRTIFDRCHLSRTRFLITDCTKIEFVDCSWPQVKRRVIVGDEFLARFDKEGSEEIRAERHKDPDWRLIGVTYNQLAKIARDRLDYPSVHHFDQGVMVMRRMERVPRRCWRKKWWDFEWPRPKENEDKDTLKRQDHHKETQGHGVACGKSETLLSKVSIWRRSFRLRPGRLIASPFYYFSWLSFYCYVSDYGRNVERTLFWLVSTVPIFALLYDLFLPSKAICSYWPQSVTLSLQVASINRHGIDIISNGGLLVNLVAILQVAITATLVALFLFSLRRRFKR